MPSRWFPTYSLFSLLVLCTCSHWLCNSAGSRDRTEPRFLDLLHYSFSILGVAVLFFLPPVFFFIIIISGASLQYQASCWRSQTQRGKIRTHGWEVLGSESFLLCTTKKHTILQVVLTMHSFHFGFSWYVETQSFPPRSPKPPVHTKAWCTRLKFFDKIKYFYIKVLNCIESHSKLPSNKRR